ncbi:hypothetical protein [Thiorhodococcus minor]|uniref:Uncharacterized protein n=1 Tax=Thiorhodococcus minor TaxID=57489 RepID=A0A6M0K5Y8_9GAMM|nr:hypothetical protein [Thiorhodococcus minor]NEV65150.1 hypothetical protein [Thiorhodococcus minor]
MSWQPERSEHHQREASSAAPRRIPLNLIFDYPVRWSRYKVLRDLIQNFYDSIPRDEWAARFSHRIEQGRLTLTSKDVDFSYDWLIPIGASTKRDGDGDYAGYFGEGFKIAALCALRDFGWTIEVRSRDWHLRVVTETLDVDGRQLQALAYEVRNGLEPTADTLLTIAPFQDSVTLETALLSFFYPDNPLLGEAIWTSPTAAVYHRSQQPKPPDYPATYNDRGPGILFAGFQALGSFSYPLVVCLHDHRGNDRERNNLYRMDVVKLVGMVAARLPPDAADAVLRIFAGRWYERPRKRYDFESWYPIIDKLVHRLAASPEQAAGFRADNPHLLVAARIKRSDLPRYNRRRQALAWIRGSGRRYRLVQEAFRALDYPDLEDACAEADGFTITRDPDPCETQRIAILESVAKTLLPDLLEQIELPPCKVIENPCTAWQGMTTCIRTGATAARWRGLRIRNRLPYVALMATLLRQDAFGDAVSTYLHELGHSFGGDSSAAFSHALSEMLSATVCHAAQIGDWQRAWNDLGECE